MLLHLEKDQLAGFIHSRRPSLSEAYNNLFKVNVMSGQILLGFEVCLNEGKPIQPVKISASPLRNG